MTKDEKIQFIKDMMFNMEMKLKAAVDKMPEDWTGKEIRQYMSDKFQSDVAFLKMNRKERLLYEEDLSNSML